MKRLLKKLNDKSAETIAETLVALLISSLAIVMLEGMITSSARVITKGNDAMQDFYTGEYKMLSEDSNYKVDGTFSLKIKNGEDVFLNKDIVLYKNTSDGAFENNTVYMYKLK